MWFSRLALRPRGTERPEERMSPADGAAGSVNTSKHTHANTHPPQRRGESGADRNNKNSEMKTDNGSEG